MGTVLDLVWAKQRGWVSVPTRRAADDKWIERWFEWPGDRPDILRWIKQANAQGDVYWSPLVYPEASRTYARECSSAWAWADVDEGDPSQGPTPTILWETSPGRTQALYRLERRVKADLLEQVNRGIASLLGADMSGWDAGQVLRVPGTVNHKYKRKPRGKILRASKATHNPQDLAANAPEPPPQPQVENAPGFEQALAEWQDALPPDVLDELLHGEAVKGQRSDKMIALINRLVRIGLPDEVVYALASGAPFNKWRGRSNEKEILTKEIAKAQAHSPSLWVAEPEPEEEEPETASTGLPLKPWSDQDWLYDYIRTGLEIMPWASPWYHLAGGLVCLAVALGNTRDLMNGVRLAPSTYIMTIGPSRSGKSESLKLAMQVLRATKTIREHVPILTEWSPQGLTRALGEAPGRHVLSFHDEAAKLFAMSKADYMLGAKDFLRELYNTLYFNKVLVKQSVSIDNPCLTWYGAITPDQFTRHFTPEDLFDGTLPRFWLFYDPDAKPTEYQPVYSRTEAAVEELAQRLDEIRIRVYNPSAAQVFGLGVPVKHLTVHAYEEAWDVLNRRLEERRSGMDDRPEMESILQNYGMDLWKFAMFRAFAAHAEDWAGVVEVTPAQVEEAFETMNAAQDNSLQLVQQLGQSKDERLIELITKFLAQQPRGRATRTKIMQRYGRSIGRGMDSLEAQMVDRGLIEVEFHRSSNGRVVKHYRLRRSVGARK